MCRLLPAIGISADWKVCPTKERQSGLPVFINQVYHYIRRSDFQQVHRILQIFRRFLRHVQSELSVVEVRANILPDLTAGEKYMGLKEIVDALMPPFLRKMHDEYESSRISEGYASAEGTEWRPDADQVSRWEWRKLISDVAAGDDLDIESHRAILRRAYAAWCRSPLAGQIVNLTTWFVMGKGLGFSARDKAVQEVLKGFWNDPENDMQVMQHWMSNELQIYGEIFCRFFANPIDGTVRMALVDPAEIRDIVSDADDVRKTVAYLREYSGAASPAEKIEAFRRDGSDIWGAFEENTVREIIDGGDVLHVKVNNVSNRKRGLSELYRVLRWLDAYERWLEDRMNINRARGTFAFLRKVPAVPSRAAGPFETDSSGKYIVPKPGSILVVHESEDWEVLSPSIGSDDAKEDGRAIKLMIAAGSGIFEHYFGDPSTGNLATTRSMELPMVKKFEDRQRLFEGVFGKIFQKVIDAKIRAGVLDADIDRTVEVSFPPIVPEDVALLTKTLVKQVETGILSKDSARRMIPWIGDASREAEAVEKEKE